MSAPGPLPRVLLVEDDAHTRARLARAIRGCAGLALQEEAGTFDAALRALSARPPDVLLTDLGLPDGNGIALIRALRARRSEALAMVITVFGDESSVLSAIEAGASGYLLKDAANEDVAEAILALVAGGSPISPAIARHLLRRFQDAPPAPEEGARSAAPSLTARELEVLRLLAKGFTFAEIAGLLSISGHTVTAHVRKIYDKLEVQSRSAAVYEAVQMGLITLRE